MQNSAVSVANSALIFTPASDTPASTSGNEDGTVKSIVDTAGAARTGKRPSLPPRPLSAIHMGSVVVDDEMGVSEERLIKPGTVGCLFAFSGASIDFVHVSDPKLICSVRISKYQLAHHSAFLI